MKLFYSDHFSFPLPEGHTFPVEKYALLRKRIKDASVVRPEEILPADAASEKDILRVHTPDYVCNFFQGQLHAAKMREVGFPWSSELVERTLRSCGATIQACATALDEGLSANLAGGTHHAFKDRGGGYCIFNDVAVAARKIQAERGIGRLAIIDCDVHHGNGTAALFADDTSVFTFSIHGKKNFPFRKERSDLDIALADGTGDEAYLNALEHGLARVFKAHRADLAIYIAGADPFYDDRFGRLALTKEGLAERDRIVLRGCIEQGTPVALTMGGGYARNVSDTVDIHVQSVKIAAEVAWEFR